MTIAFWIVSGLLALVFVFAGVMKMFKPRTALIESGMGWAEDYSDAGAKGVGAVEFVGGLGLVIPALTGILPVLSPIAAVALTVVMGVATATHVRRKESVMPSLILGILTLVAAVLGFATQLG